MHACAFWMHLRPPLPPRKISVHMLHVINRITSTVWESAWAILLDGFYMPSHAGLGASHIQLVAIEFWSYTATTKGSCSPFCRVCVCVCMLNVLSHFSSHFSNGQFMLVDTCSSRSGNQYSTDLVGWRHMIQHDYLQFLFLLYFICCCYCQSLYLQKLMYTD